MSKRTQNTQSYLLIKDTQPFCINPGHFEGTLGKILLHQHNMNLRHIRGPQNIGPTYTHKIQVLVCNTQFKKKKLAQIVLLFMEKY